MFAHFFASPATTERKRGDELRQRLNACNGNEVLAADQLSRLRMVAYAVFHVGSTQTVLQMRHFVSLVEG